MHFIVWFQFQFLIFDQLIFDKSDDTKLEFLKLLFPPAASDHKRKKIISIFTKANLDLILNYRIKQTSKYMMSAN